MLIWASVIKQKNRKMALKNGNLRTKKKKQKNMPRNLKKQKNYQILGKIILTIK